VAKAKRYKLNGDTGITLVGPGIPEKIWLDPEHHYTTDDPSVQQYLDSSADVSEVKIPDTGKKRSG